MEDHGRRVGTIAVGLEGLSFLWFLLLRVLGIFGSKQSPFALHASRLVLYLLLAGFLTGLVGAFIDRKKFLAGFAMVALIPILTIMGMLCGYW